MPGSLKVLQMLGMDIRKCRVLEIFAKGIRHSQ